MSTANARGGRRRWMLHEDVRAGVAAIDDELNEGDCTARSYAFDDRSASYAVASRLFPRRLLSIGAILTGGMAITTALALAEAQSSAICAWLGIQELPAVQSGSQFSIAAWLSNLLLIAAASICLLIYGLRRHRLDDFHGKYRRWLAATGVCVLATLTLSSNLHHSLAHAAAGATGFTALPGNAFWWLLPSALVVGWISVRVALDMRRCRFGLFFLAIAAGLYAIALAGRFGILSAAIADNAPSAIVELAGHVWLVVALLAQVRFILFEASGEVPEQAKPALASTKAPAVAKPTVFSETSTSPQKPVAPPAVAMTVTESRKSSSNRQPARKSLIAAAKSETKWIDGRNSRDADEEDEERPLSKAERKRLRKEHSRRAA